jgi:hypothetical protein
LVLAAGIDADSNDNKQAKQTKWADVSKIQLQNLAHQLSNASFQVNGKSTFK